MKFFRMAIILITVLMLTGCQSRDRHYEAAIQSMANGKYDEAYSIFETMEGYKDSESYSRYCAAVIDANSGNFDSATVAMGTLAAENFLDSAIRTKYYSARAIEAAGDVSRYEEAAALYLQCKGWGDSAERRNALIGMTGSADAGAFDNMPVAEDIAATPAPPETFSLSETDLSPSSK